MSTESMAVAWRLQALAAAEGFDWPEIEGVWAKLAEELEELRGAVDSERRAEEFGDVLFALVNLARRLGIDADAALASANAKFVRRYAAVRAELDQLPPPGDPQRLQCMEALWQQAKRRERHNMDNDDAAAAN